MNEEVRAQLQGMVKHIKTYFNTDRDVGELIDAFNEVGDDLIDILKEEKSRAAQS